MSNVNKFIEQGLQESAKTFSQKGALKYFTTGNIIIDQFGKLGAYRVIRSKEEIFRDCELLWNEDKLTALKFIIFLRTINRNVSYFDGTKSIEPQNGAELKHESIVRMIWLYNKDKETFWSNIDLFITAGSWKDIFTMIVYDVILNGWKDRILDWDLFADFIISNLDNDNNRHIILKYLPAVKSKAKCTTERSKVNNAIAKMLCFKLFGKKKTGKGFYKKYRMLKNSGEAHKWQQLISQREFDKLNFDKIHGRALSKLVNGYFLTNHKLGDKYSEWINSKINNNGDVKYTGYVHELLNNVENASKAEVLTINKQFETLVKKGGEKPISEMIVVRDTSGSMGLNASGCNVSCFNIAKALALYFSEFLKGEFTNAWIEFNKSAEFRKWIGETPVEKWLSDGSKCIGNTNFQSVIDLFVKLKNNGVEESDFPKGILCISDCEFDSTELNETNVNVALNKLREAGFSETYVDNFKIVLWNLISTSGGGLFETYGDVKNVFYFSGYSATILSFLTGEVKNMNDLILNILNQELLNKVKIFK